MSHESSPISVPPPSSQHGQHDKAENQHLAEQASDSTIQTPIAQQQGDQSSPFSSAVVNECLQSAQRFRGGEYSREEALFHVFDALGSLNQPSALVFQAARPYVDMLDKIVDEQRTAEDRGCVLVGAHAPSEPNRDAEPQVPVVNVAVPVGKKRRRAEADDDSDNDEDRAGKRPLDLSALPWMQNVRAVPLPQDLTDTRRLLLLFAEEPKRWKTFFTNEPNCPQFPDTEWTNVLLGKPVNLDLVLASMYNVSLESKLKERLGRVSLSLDDVALAKIVKSQGEWMSAWTRMSEAIAFVFRHRRDELAQYSAYISSLFTSILEANHSRVLQYDRAVRLRVSSRRDLYLTDVHQFGDLHLQWLSLLGAGPGSSTPRSSGARSAARSGKRDPCRRWNDGKCPFTATTCNWAHVCLKCSGSHVASACTQRG